VTVTSPLHPELQGYYEEEGGGRGERATRLSEPTGPSRPAGRARLWRATAGIASCRLAPARY